MKSHLLIQRRKTFAVAIAFSLCFEAAAQERHEALPSQSVSMAAISPAHRLPEAPHTVSLRSSNPRGRSHEPLTVADLEALALANNPTLVQASRRIEALRGKHLQVGLPPNPMIGYQGEEIGDDGDAGQQGMFLGQQLVTGGKLGLDRAVVSHEIAQARHETGMQRMRVINAVRARAFEVIVTQRAVALNEQLVALGDEGLLAAEKLREAKEVSLVDVLQARVEANSARLGLSNAQNDQQAAWRQLAVVVGVPDMASNGLVDNLDETPPDLAWENCLLRLLSESPELARARSGVERAKCVLARAQAGRTPNIDLETAVRYNNASEYTTASVGIGIPLQLFDRNQGNIHQAHAELAAARREVRRVELQLQDRLAVTFKQYTNANLLTTQYKRQILPDARSSLELVRKGYEQGEFGYLELLTAQRTFFRANLAHIESLRELWLSAVQIEGLLLSGGLTQPGA